MKFLNLIIISAVLVSCAGPTGGGNQRDPNVSPFEDNKVIISSSVTSQMAQSSSSGQVNGSSTLPQGLDLGFIVDDQCIVQRRQRNNKVRYYIDKYIQNPVDDSDDDPLKESVVSVQVKKDLTIKELEYLVKLDYCVIGVADLQKHQVNSAAFSDPHYQAQLGSYLDRIGFTKAEQFFQSNVPSNIKVNVAVIDSGYDLAQGDIRDITDNIEGLDVIGLDSDPQDTNGHGTQVANIIGAPGNSQGVVGIASRNTTLIPVRMFGDKGQIQVDGGFVFNSIKRAVNAGAEIINMSFSAIVDQEGIIGDDREEDKALTCSPIIGHAIFRSIQRNVFLSMAAGHGTSYEKYQSGPERGKWKKFKRVNGELVECAAGDSACTERKKLPGTIRVPHDNGGEFFGNNSMPACWSRYFEGAVSVAALESGKDEVASFSNWSADGIFGDDGVEIAAPGVEIVTETIGGRKEVTQGTSFSTPQVSGAAVLIKAFYKHQQAKLKASGGNPKEWSITPWMIESIIMESAEEVQSLAESNKPVRRGRVLSLSGIAEYLSSLAGLDFAQRRILASINDNAEIGEGHGSLALNGERTSESSDFDQLTIVGSDLYSRNRFINQYDQAQLQMVVYYNNGATEVVTDKASFQVLSGKGQITDNGVLLPAEDYIGRIQVEGRFKNRKSIFDVFVTDVNAVTGTANLIPEQLEIEVKDVKCCHRVDNNHGTAIRTSIYAVHGDGSRRDVTKNASLWSVSNRGDEYPGYSGIVRTGNFYGGDTITLTATYLGVKGTFEVTLPKTNITADRVFDRSGRPLTDYLQKGKVSFTFQEGHTSLARIYLDFDGTSQELENTNKQLYFKQYNPLKLAVGTHVSTFTITDHSSGIEKVFNGQFTNIIEEDSPVDFTIANQFDFNNSEIEDPYIDSFDPFRDRHLFIGAITKSGTIVRVHPDDYKIRVFYNNIDQTDKTNINKDFHSLSRFSFYPYTHQINKDHYLEIEHLVLKKKKRFKFRYSGQTKKVVDHDFVTRNALDAVKASFNQLGWSIQNDNSKGYDVLTVVNPKQENLQCLGGKSNLKGAGSQSEPFIICDAEQLYEIINLIRENSLRGKSIYAELANHIDLTNSTKLRESVLFVNGQIDRFNTFHNVFLDGKGYEIRNLAESDTEKEFAGIFGLNCPSLRNIGFSNMFIRGETESFLLCEELRSDTKDMKDFENVYITKFDVTTFSNGSSASDSHLIKRVSSLKKPMKNILLEGTMQGARYVAPFYSTNRIDNLVASMNIGNVLGSTSGGRFAGVTINASRSENVLVNIQLKLGAGVSYSSAAGFATSGFLISNVHVKGRVESTGGSVSGLISATTGRGYDNQLTFISNSSFDGGVYGLDNVGGLIGYGRDFRVQGSKVSGIVSGQQAVGGIAGAGSFGILHDNDLSTVQISGTSNKHGALIGTKVILNDIPSNYLEDILSNNKYNGVIYGGGVQIPFIQGSLDY